jgi:hypothetical protein
MEGKKDERLVEEGESKKKNKQKLEETKQNDSVLIFDH